MSPKYPNRNTQEKNDRIAATTIVVNGKNDSAKQEISKEEKEDSERVAQLMERVILLLSFKDAPQQKLPEILNALDIKTMEEKARVLQEIYRLIQEGIVFIEEGIPELMNQGFSPTDLLQDKVLIRLLRPYDKIISEILRELTTYQERHNL